MCQSTTGLKVGSRHLSGTRHSLVISPQRLSGTSQGQNRLIVLVCTHTSYGIGATRGMAFCVKFVMPTWS
jgi:hypothetical protein